jgi:hypothetical protein
VEQFDIFGKSHEIKNIDKPGKKFHTMQQDYGVLKNHICGDCYNFLRYDYHGKIYRKCQLWRLSHCDATDIRAKDIACKKFEPKEVIP